MSKQKHTFAGGDEAVDPAIRDGRTIDVEFTEIGKVERNQNKLASE